MGELEYVNIKEEHAERLEEFQKLCFPNVDPDELFHADELRHQARLFPEGTFVVLDGDKVVGLGAGIFLNFDFDHPQHTLSGITGGAYYGGHNPDGEWYYGTDISVHPEYRRRGIGQELYNLRKAVVKQFNKQGIIAGGVLPGFHKVQDEMSVEEYVKKVVDGELYDSTLSFQLRNGFEVRGILEEYFPHPESGHYASLIVWENPDFDPDK